RDLRGCFVQREGEIEHLRQRTALWPFIALESLAEPADHVRRSGRVTSRAPYIEKQTHGQFRALVPAVRQRREDTLPPIHRIASHKHRTFGMCEQFMDDNA